MGELRFDCLDVAPQPYAVGPTLMFRLRVSDADAEPVHAIALRCQMRIEPQRRSYGEHERELLAPLFGESSRWGETLKPMEFTQVSTMVPSFTGSTEFDLPVPCSYDLEVASGTYFHALEDGEVPLLLLFSGTVFAKGDRGFWVRQIPWHTETTYRLPVEVWRRLMDTYFPASGWLRLRRDTLDALLRYRSDNAIPTWEAAIDKLLGEGP